MLFVSLKKIIFLRFCLCIFESDTVKSDCPVQMFRIMMKYLKIYHTSFTVFFSGDIYKKKALTKKTKKKQKKKNLKMTSLLVIFRGFFFRLADPRSEKKSCKSTNKKNLALA